jgi:hypothetical protein
MKSGGLSDRNVGDDFEHRHFVEAALTRGAQIEADTGPSRDLKRKKGNGELKRQLFHGVFPSTAVSGRRIKISIALTRRISVWFLA